MKSKLIESTFNYSSPNSTDSNPRVLVTSENQHMIRGFAMNRLTRSQSQAVQSAWKAIAGQPWSITTKEQIVMKRTGIRNAFRKYKREYVSEYFKRAD
jgi:hypothetical protein